MSFSPSLYIHIPFCLSKCDYCDFFSKPCASVPEDYVSALVNEIVWARKVYGVDFWDTVYIGGGTPSLLKPAQLERIMNAVFCEVPKSVLAASENSRVPTGNAPREITMEMNPESLTVDLLETAKASGVTRLSLGIQSLTDGALSSVHRRCSARRAQEVLSLVRTHWYGDLSADIIAGLPGETEESFITSLKTLLSYRPEHISMYSLTVEDETPLGVRIKNGMEWDSDAADKMWLRGREVLFEAGYRQYEVSNFCLEGHESVHNGAYWKQSDYVGAGSGACGSLYGFSGGNAGGFRWVNDCDVRKYTDFWCAAGTGDVCAAEDVSGDPENACAGQRHATGSENACAGQRNAAGTEDTLCRSHSIPRETEELSLETMEFEFLMMGFRTLKGVSGSEYRKRFSGVSPWNGSLRKRLGEEKSGSLWEKYLQNGWCRKSGEYYSLTEDGILYLNSFLTSLA